MSGSPTPKAGALFAPEVQDYKLEKMSLLGNETTDTLHRRSNSSDSLTIRPTPTKPLLVSPSGDSAWGVFCSRNGIRMLVLMLGAFIAGQLLPGLNSSFAVMKLYGKDAAVRRVDAPSLVDLDAQQPIDPIPMSPKTVLVTGAAGFIGSHVADALLLRGDNVVVIDEMNDYYSVDVKEQNLQLLTKRIAELKNRHDREGLPKVVPTLDIFKGDVADLDFLRHIFGKTRPDFICHLAARAGVRPSIDDPMIYVHSNVHATTQLMQVVAEYNQQQRDRTVQNFVYASSSSVYGGSPSSLFSESELVDFPISPYAATKKSTELMAYTYHHLYNISMTSLRFFTVYGPRGRPDMAPFKFVDKISRGQPIQRYGDGTAFRDFTFVADIVDGILRAIDRPYPYQILNLGRGKGTSLSNFIEIIEKHTGRTANIEVLPEQPGDVPYTRADIRRAQRLLGYDPQVDIDEGIRRTVEWYNATMLPLVQQQKQQQQQQQQQRQQQRQTNTDKGNQEQLPANQQSPSQQQPKQEPRIAHRLRG